LCGHGVSPKNSIKGRKKIRLFRRVFTPLLTKNYSFWIKMSTRIKRLTFEILHYKAKSKNLDYRKEELEGWVLGFTYYSSKSEGEIYRRFAIEVSRKGRALSDEPIA
jgi:hypothetical protein